MHRLMTSLAAMILLSLCFLLLSVPVADAADIEIVKTLKVGKVYKGLAQPMRYSTDGKWLAYFDRKELMICDTLGYSRAVTEFATNLQQIDWSDENHVVLLLGYRFKNGDMSNRLCEVDIRTAEQVNLEEWYVYSGDDWPPGETVVLGLYRTFEGDLYYHAVCDGLEFNKIIRPSVDASKADQPPQHFIRAGRDAVYLVRVDEKDSTKISNKPYRSARHEPLLVSPDTTHLMFGALMVRLADDSMVVLDDLTRKMTDELKWGRVSNYSFSPVDSKVIFSQATENGQPKRMDRLGTYDYLTGKVTILDPLLGLTNCSRPVFSPDGKRVAFVSGQELFFFECKLPAGESK